MQLRGRESLARELQNVYMCPIRIDFSGVKNDSPKPNRSGSDVFKEKLMLKNGQTVLIHYFFSDSIDVHSLTVL